MTDPAAEKALAPTNTIEDDDDSESGLIVSTTLPQVDQDTLEKLAKDQLVSEFKATKFRKEAGKHWDLFYKRNTTKFFKDRHWTDREFEELRPVENGAPKVLVGCGVGNFAFPLLEANKDLFIYACDFSKRAVEFVKANASYDESRCKAFQCDIVNDDICQNVPSASADLVSMIFVLSAIPPEKMVQALENVWKILKPGGLVLFRDYGLYDTAQLRFKPGHKMADNFYVRQDGTFSYYFNTEFLSEIFAKAGFETVENTYVHKQVQQRTPNPARHFSLTPSVASYDHPVKNSAHTSSNTSTSASGQSHPQDELDFSHATSSQSTTSSVWTSSAIVEQYASQKLSPVTLQYLLQLGEQHSVIESAQLLREELPKRLARRIKAIQNLPFIVGVNPWIRSVYNLYCTSFEMLRNMPPITDEKSQELFSTTLKELVSQHQDVIPKLARGFAECGKYMSKEARTQFLDGMIHARIGIRVLAEHHLALVTSEPNWIGIVHTRLNAANLMRSVANYVEELCEINYGSSPGYNVNGHVDTAVIPYIPVHVEYIMMELMKNAMRATVECSMKTGRIMHPDVEITVASGEEDITIRIRDQGGGISEKDLPRVFEYSYTTVPSYDEELVESIGPGGNIFATTSRMSMQAGVGGPMAGLGFGLPMSRIY
ncbi:Methyltransferase-like protein 6, partial [Quaeritorhiza haematococci]